MIKSTIQLFEYLNQDNDKIDFFVVDSYVNSILKLGSKEDAELLLNSYLKNPTEAVYSWLFCLFKKFGDTEFAEKIYEIVIDDDNLIDEVDPDVLTLLGDLKYEPIKDILFQYAFAKDDTYDHFQSSSILGLLNFDCSEYIEEIKLNIQACLNKDQFPQFIPALVCKLPDRQMILEQLYEKGSKYAFSECNAGIILGFSMCGEEGKVYFKKTLFNPDWATYEAATDTIKYTYEGMKNLNISFAELLSDIKQISDNTQLEYALNVLFSLFDMRIFDYDDDRIDTFRNLHHIFYNWRATKSHILMHLASNVDKTKKASNYERIFRLKMTEEVIFENTIGNIEHINWKPLPSKRKLFRFLSD